MIIIRHTHRDGTILEGSTKGDGVYEIVRQHGFTWRRSVGIFIRGSRDKDAQQQNINAAAEALRAAGHEVTIEVDNQWRPAAEREADRAARAADRVERLEAGAAKAAAGAAAAHAAAHEIAARRPFGQPVLEGHHSERRHRADIKRGNDLDRRGRTLDDKAGRKADRAAGAAANEAAKHNPHAIVRRVETLEAKRRTYQRRHDKATAGGEYQQRMAREIARLTDDIDHQQRTIDAMREAGEYDPWQRDHFQKGDRVRLARFGGWYTVTRINAKSVSIIDQEQQRTIGYNDIGGRRRGGLQLDQPSGQPWPVELAVKVARWSSLAARASRRDHEYSDLARNVNAAMRMVYGLPVTASDAEVRAFPTPAELAQQRELSARLLAVYERLDAGEPWPDVAASLPAYELAPAWRIPTDRQPQDVRIDHLKVGDLVAGVWEHHGGGRRLWRTFAGPIASVDAQDCHGEHGTHYTLTTDDGAVYEGRGQSIWLAVHRNETAAGPSGATAAPDCAASTEPTVEPDPNHHNAR
ncbi:hypothetical protein NUM_07540 [Actinocatenispora comari]|uniref:DUF3560 domain-containing protein n=2 Tax=Actinocatenispora comari TaxID=2807577 RepID=A0A8J4A5R4_9ACTN|nr:hypothetical protein NUM_07540 [Actinocatenispora comari]